MDLSLIHISEPTRPNFISSFVNFRNVASGSREEDDEDVLISKMEL